MPTAAQTFSGGVLDAKAALVRIWPNMRGVEVPLLLRCSGLSSSSRSAAPRRFHPWGLVCIPARRRLCKGKCWKQALSGSCRRDIRVRCALWCVRIGGTTDASAAGREVVLAGDRIKTGFRRWWNTMGASTYPDANRLLITADSGGSNGSRLRL